MQGVGARMTRLPADPLIFQPFNCEIIPYVFILLLPGDGRGVGLLVRVEWGGRLKVRSGRSPWDVSDL